MPEIPQPPQAQSSQQVPSQAPKQAPFGSSPTTGPTPNRGYEAAGMQRLGMIVKQLGDLIPMLGATSEIGQAVMKAVQNLAKHVPPGAVTPASEKNTLEQLALKNAQQNQTVQQMRQQGQGGQGGPPQAMMPQAGQKVA